MSEPSTPALLASLPDDPRNILFGHEAGVPMFCKRRHDTAENEPVRTP